MKLLIILGFIAAAYACSDQNTNCPRWGKYCESNGYVKANCKKTCGKCEDSCKDNHASCPTWKQHCGQHSYVIKNCKKTCGTCSGGSGGGGGSGSSGQCGISKVSQSRVVNGDEAEPGAWPWIASLQTSSGFHFCGASILTPYWILTASHCVEGRNNNPGSLRVVVGAHNKNARESTQQKLSAQRIIMHPNYKQGGGLNADVALIQLSTPVRFNDRVVKSCMPQQGVYPETGKNCYIAGWGTTTHPGNSPSKLQQAKLPVVGTPHRGCHNNREVVCVGHGFGTQSNGKQHPNACRGDSGGPLMCQRSDGRWVVEGVASYVYTYCKYYTAYAPVNKYLSWIKQYVRDL